MSTGYSSFFAGYPALSAWESLHLAAVFLLIAFDCVRFFGLSVRFNGVLLGMLNVSPFVLNRWEIKGNSAWGIAWAAWFSGRPGTLAARQ